MSEENTKQLDPDAALTEAQAAEFLGYSRSCLKSWRWVGKGPKFIKQKTGKGNRGSVRYLRSELIAWRKTNWVAAQSTAESKVS